MPRSSAEQKVDGPVCRTVAQKQKMEP